MNTVEVNDLKVHAGFTAIPNAIHNLPLSKIALAILKILLIFKWDKEDCYPSLAKLMHYSRSSKNSVLAGIRELVYYRIIKCQRRGDGQTNHYHFLDPDLDTMIKRVLTMPPRPPRSKQVKATNPTNRRNQADEMPWDLMQMFQAEIIPSDYISELTFAEPLLGWFAPLVMEMEETMSARAVEEKAVEPQLSHQPAPIATELPAAQIGTDQPGDFRSSQLNQSEGNILNQGVVQNMPTKTLRSENIQKKNTHTRSRAGVCFTAHKSKYSLDECVEYAASLLGKGITNPVGFGTAIRGDGRADDKIAAFLAAKQTLATQTTTQTPASSVGSDNLQAEILHEHLLEQRRQAAFNALSPVEQQHLITAKIAEIKRVHGRAVRFMPQEHFVEKAIYFIQKELVPDLVN